MKTASLIFFLVAACGPAQELWAPKSDAPGAYAPPHKPWTKLADLKAKHAGQAEWRELIVDDEHLHAVYIQSKPGAKEPRALHPDTRAWWVVMEGQIRFDMEGQQPFVASKGSMVQVPMQTLFSLETTSDGPALRFEVNIHGAKTLYTRQADTPQMPGFNWMPVRFFNRAVGVYGRNNKPHATFDELAKDLEEGRRKGTLKVVEDDRGAANFIYGYEKNLPPINPKDKGHYHPEGAEFWLIMAGQIRYPIEGQGVIIASEGDVVYVPKFTFHAPRWYGQGPSCRLAMNGYPNIAHLFEPSAQR
ncbi:MAG: cupin domain-containing protein [Candidatus Solibacter usitatus]|nr:cupin domain-containing protein [Candidatus Solibacter usitatus]